LWYVELALSLKCVAEVAAVYVLHLDIRQVIVKPSYGIDRDNGRMRNPSGGLRFADETLLTHRVICETSTKNFESNKSLQMGVTGKEYMRNLPFAEASDKGVGFR
jgi:hypothetical protein